MSAGFQTVVITALIVTEKFPDPFPQAQNFSYLRSLHFARQSKKIKLKKKVFY